VGGGLSATAQMARQLQAAHRWAVTGTPIGAGVCVCVHMCVRTGWWSELTILSLVLPCCLLPTSSLQLTAPAAVACSCPIQQHLHVTTCVCSSTYLLPPPHLLQVAWMTLQACCGSWELSRSTTIEFLSTLWRNRSRHQQEQQRQHCAVSSSSSSSSRWLSPARTQVHSSQMAAACCRVTPPRQQDLRQCSSTMAQRPVTAYAGC
jgi:hypothetical protein